MRHQLNTILTVFVLSTALLFSCEKKKETLVDKPDLSNIKTDSVDYEALKKAEPNYEEVFFGDESGKISGNYSVSVTSDLWRDGILSDECYLTQVNLFVEDLGTGQKYLVTSSQVKAGKCAEQTKDNASTECSGSLPDGNWVMKAEKEKYNQVCLYRILSKNEEAYSKYQTSITELVKKVQNNLDSYKKMIVEYKEAEKGMIKDK